MSIRDQLIGAAVCVALGMAAAWTAQEWRHGARQARIEAAHAQLLEQQAQAFVASAQAARNEEARRTAAVEEQRNDAIKQNEALSADVAAGRTVSERLRAELDALRARHAGSNATAAQRSQGQPSADPIGVLIGVLEGMDDAGREVAEYADRLRIAGLACERSYDAVRGKEKPPEGRSSD